MKQNNDLELVRCPYQLFDKLIIKNPKTPKEKKYADNFPMFMKVVRENFWNKLNDWDDKIQEMALKYWSILDKLDIDGSNKPFKYLQLHLSHAQNRTCKHLISKFSIPLKMNREDAYNRCPQVISLQTSIGENGNIYVEDVVGQDSTDDIDERVDEIYNKRLYRKLTSYLLPRDKDMCSILFNDDIPKTKRMNYVAKIYGISNKRVFQIKQRALKKLKDIVKKRGITFNE